MRLIRVHTVSALMLALPTVVSAQNAKVPRLEPAVRGPASSVNDAGSNLFGLTNLVFCYDQYFAVGRLCSTRPTGWFPRRFEGRKRRVIAGSGSISCQIQHITNRYAPTFPR